MEKQHIISVEDFRLKIAFFRPAFIAQRMGVTPATIRNWASGRIEPSANMRIAFATFLIQLATV